MTRLLCRMSKPVVVSLIVFSIIPLPGWEGHSLQDRAIIP